MHKVEYRMEQQKNKENGRGRIPKEVGAAGSADGTSASETQQLGEDLEALH